MTGRFTRQLAVTMCVTILFPVLRSQMPGTPGGAGTVGFGPENDPALVQVPEDPKLPRVLIVGDSVSMGYTWEARRMLAGRANVQHAPVNCGPSQYGVQNIHGWLGKGHWDVIYFNFGLHDLKYVDAKGQLTPPDKGTQVASVEQYRTNLKTVAGVLKLTGAKLIFATTTPVPAGADGRVESDELRYNTAATELMAQMGIDVNDLHALVSASPALQRPHNVHFTTEGYRVLGDEAASRIEHDLPATPR